MAATLLTTHHVGGRAGTRTFPSLKYFEKDIVNVLYEAEESSISGIKKETHYLPSKTIILPDCLSGSAGKRKFYIYNNRYFKNKESIICINNRRFIYVFNMLQYFWQHNWQQ